MNEGEEGALFDKPIKVISKYKYSEKFERVMKANTHEFSF